MSERSAYFILFYSPNTFSRWGGVLPLGARKINLKILNHEGTKTQRTAIFYAPAALDSEGKSGRRFAQMNADWDDFEPIFEDLTPFCSNVTSHFWQINQN
jgi:hypothetical protein